MSTLQEEEEEEEEYNYNHNHDYDQNEKLIKREPLAYTRARRAVQSLWSVVFSDTYRDTTADKGHSIFTGL